LFDYFVSELIILFRETDFQIIVSNFFPDGNQIKKNTANTLEARCENLSGNNLTANPIVLKRIFNNLSN